MTVRHLLILVFVIGCTLGRIMQAVRHAGLQRDAVAAIGSRNGRVSYDWEYRANGLRPRPSPPRWLADRIGVDYFGDVSRVEVSADSDDELIPIGSLRRLEYLELTAWPGALHEGAARITDAGLAHLKPLTNLQELRLEGHGFSDAGMIHLAGLIGLRALNLNLTSVGDPGLSHLKNLAYLRRLGLWGTGVTDAGMVHLAGLRELRFLDLGGTRVGDAGLAHLRGLAHLHDLDLSYTRVTDSGLVHLVGLAGLAWVDLRHAAVTDAGVKRLRKALPGTAIVGGSDAPPRRPWTPISWMRYW